MANSFDYIVKTRNRCVVRAFFDTSGAGLTIGITASAFGYSDLPGGDTQITNSSACLSRVAYGISGAQGGATNLLLRYGTAGPILPNPVLLCAGNNTQDLNFERLTLPNNALTADGTMVAFMNGSSTGMVTAYLEFVPF